MPRQGRLADAIGALSPAAHKIEHVSAASPQPARAAYFDAAKRLLRDGDPDAITLRALAAAAGASRGALHYHYGSLDDLLGHAGAAILDETLDSLRAGYSSARNISEALVVGERVIDERTAMSLIGIATFSVRRGRPEWRDFLAGWRRVVDAGVPKAQAGTGGFLVALSLGFALRGAPPDRPLVPALAEALSTTTTTKD